MIIPKFWGSASREVKKPDGGSLQFVKWYWSNHSIDDARDKARQRIEAMANRVAAGEPFPSRLYPYGEDQPLREEIVREVALPNGDNAVITRNAYGALILNVEKVMFVDIDLPPEPERRKAAASPGGGFAGLMGKLFGAATGVPAPPPLPQQAPPLPLSGNEATAVTRVEQWTASRPGWGFRIYRTTLGLRLIATHDLIIPDAPETLRAMEQLGCDPLYLQLCKSQKSFRARLTPKPWRVNFYSPSIKFPYNNPDAMQTWVKDYQAASAGRPTCRFIKSAGNGSIEPTVQAIVDLHDELSMPAGNDGRLA